MPRRRFASRCWNGPSASSIGPETERASHYFHARLSAQFDAVLHFDETRAVEPLERTSEWEAGEVPETFPDRDLEGEYIMKTKEIPRSEWPSFL